MNPAAGVEIGATIMGRNMFGPIRGPWPDDEWKGWWGDEPPYHHQVFVLTHHLRASFDMRGGTTFHFVTDADPNRVLGRALDAAGGRDVKIAGGPSTVQQFMRAGLIDELHLAIVPALLGSGERFFDHLAVPVGYECVEFVGSPAALHVRLARVRDPGREPTAG
ncbi:MAG TPA: dihydrofolate reductase family protein [Nakamurella sp.]